MQDVVPYCVPRLFRLPAQHMACTRHATAAALYTPDYTLLDPSPIQMCVYMCIKPCMAHGLAANDICDRFCTKMMSNTPTGHPLQRHMLRHLSGQPQLYTKFRHSRSVRSLPPCACLRCVVNFFGHLFLFPRGRARPAVLLWLPLSSALQAIIVRHHLHNQNPIAGITAERIEGKSLQLRRLVSSTWKMPGFTLSLKAYAKIVLHCCKYPNKAVNGVVIV